MSDPLDLARQLWDDGPLGPLVVAGGGLSAVAAAWLFKRALTVGLNVEAFTDQIRKLINAGNVPRAVKLCNAVGANPLGVLAATGLRARQEGSSAMSAMQEQSPSTLAALQRGLVPAAFIGAMSALCAAALLATHLQAPYVPLVLGLAVLDAGVLAFAARAWLRAARDVNLLVQQTGDL